MKAKISKTELKKIWDSVPVNYYQSSINSNPLQKFWHTNKLNCVDGLITIKPSNILDVGSASGWFLSELKKRHPSAHCVGVDVYKKAIDYGKKTYPNLSLITADVHKLPFPKNSFTTIVCAEVLEHVVDPIQVLKEIKRVAKPTSEIIIEMDSGNWLFKTVWKLWTSLRGKVWHDAHIQIYDANRLKQDIEESGLKIVQTNFFNIGMAVCYKCKK